jgi:hypothetical protein
MDKEQELSLLQITAQYVDEIQKGRKPHLSDYLARYPDYADAIADFVAYYHAVEEAMPSREAIPLTGMVVPSREATKGFTVNRVPARESLTTLLYTATGQRLTLSQLATELDLSIDIVLLLEQRAIASATIPYVLCEKIATLLQRPRTMVQQYLSSLDQREPGSAVHREKQPIRVAEESANYSEPYVMDRPSFRAIVEASLQLSVEQRGCWRTILDAKGA